MWFIEEQFCIRNSGSKSWERRRRRKRVLSGCSHGSAEKGSFEWLVQIVDRRALESRPRPYVWTPE